MGRYDPKAAPSSVSVTSYNQMGGITAHTVNVGRASRTINDGLRNQILNELPRDKPITVLGLLGDPESCLLAEQIHSYLKDNDFPLTEDGISQSVFSPTPKGLVVVPRGDRLDFIVGANT